MSALNNQTNKNPNRFFFATAENGEQTLGLQFGTTGGTPNLSTMAVTISGASGNGVIVNQAPSFQATDYIFAEEGMGVYGSTYFTPSTLATTVTGINLTSDRVPGSGVACIEAYGGNGSQGGFELLSRGVNSALISTTSAAANQWMSSIGRPGATAVLGSSGTFLTGGVQAAALTAFDFPSPAGAGALNISDLSATAILPRWSIGKFGATPGGNAGSDLALFSYDDAGSFLGNVLQVRRSDGAMNINNLSSVNSAIYPQNLLSTVMTGTQGVVATSNVVSLLFSHSSATTSNMIAGQNYLVDVPANIITGAPGGSGAWLDMGLRLGSNGSFNYVQSMFIPPGGTPPQGVGQGIIQICDMGSSNKNIDIVGYLQGVASLSISTSQSIGGAGAFMKMMT